jgi:DNA-binding response OmpR family regulator
MKRVLIIEDNQMLANLYRGSLAGAGFAVEVAPDGDAGLKSAKASNPDVILLDLMLPKKTGLDVLNSIRADEQLKAVPVLLLSNAYTPARTKELWDAGATQVLVKANTTPKQILESVRAALGS